MSDERRVINIDKDKFDIIKKYCEDNFYKISDWSSNILIEKIKGEKMKNILEAYSEGFCDSFNEELKKLKLTINGHIINGCNIKNKELQVFEENLPKDAKEFINNSKLKGIELARNFYNIIKSESKNDKINILITSNEKNYKIIQDNIPEKFKDINKNFVVESGNNIKFLFIETFGRMNRGVRIMFNFDYQEV